MNRMKSSFNTMSSASKVSASSPRGISSTSSVASSELPLSSPGFRNSDFGSLSSFWVLLDLLESVLDLESLKMTEDSKASSLVSVALRSRLSWRSRSRSAPNCILSTPDVRAAIDCPEIPEVETSELFLQLTD
jgi:hypothetical protein